MGALNVVLSNNGFDINAWKLYSIYMKNNVV